MSDDNLKEIYSIDIKSVSSFVLTKSQKNAGGNMKVSPIMLLKTSIVKMTENELAIMLLKNQIVTSYIPLC